jgi:hypothetical protein
MKLFLVIVVIGLSHAGVVVDNHEAIHRCIANVLSKNKAVQEVFKACHANNGPNATNCIMAIPEIATCFNASRSSGFYFCPPQLNMQVFISYKS